MTQLDKLEASLDEALNKKAPFKLPETSRKNLAEMLWIFSLIGGVLQLYLAWRLWDVWHSVGRFVEYLNSYAEIYGVDTGANKLSFAFYLVLFTLLASGVLLLLATPNLKALKKAGWNLVFYSLLLNLLYGVIVLFTDYGNLGNLFGAALGSFIGAYLLFQVRDQFVRSHTSPKS